jgi:poly(A) polymerase Pap1
MRVHYASIDVSKVKKSLVLSDKRLLRARSINLYTLKHLITSGRVTQENLAISPYKQLVETCSKKYLGGVEYAWGGV